MSVVTRKDPADQTRKTTGGHQEASAGKQAQRAESLSSLSLVKVLVSLGFGSLPEC